VRQIKIVEPLSVVKRTYFMLVFRLGARVIYKCQMLSVVMLERSEIIDTYNTPDTIVRDKRTK